jgi:predicted ArsR family transcriptional regulator
VSLSDVSWQALEQTMAALRDPTRRRILLSFYDNPAHRTIDEVATSAGVHRTVAFQHLERLAALGYLATDRRHGLRGKPAKVYRLARGPIELSHPARLHRQLADLLAQALDRMGSAGRAASRNAGRDFGGSLGVQRVAPDLEEALVPLAALGGRYVLEPEGALVAINCVFREACVGAPQVVCGLHAGMLEGVLAAAGQPHTVVPLGPRPGDGCAFAMEPKVPAPPLKPEVEPVLDTPNSK